MSKLSVAIFFSAYLAVVFSAFLSDGVKEFRFTKLIDGSNEYEFEYDIEPGETFRGKTFYINDDSDPKSHIYIVFGKNDVLYWVNFNDEEYENKRTLSKTVRLVERNNESLTFEDDFIAYNLLIAEAIIFVTPYQTSWDMKQICFTKSKAGNGTFAYVINATNNSRKYNGTTYLEKDDLHVQRIHLDDGFQRDDVYEILFTNEELSSNAMFCKGISKIISESGVLGAYPISNINPNLLKSLAG